MAEGEVETLVLPLSGWVFQWRADGSWRDLDPRQLAAERRREHVARDDEWVAWTGTSYRQARSGAPVGGSGWWLLHDELPVGAEPRVRLPDGRRPEVQRFHGLWLCEWVGRAQAVVVDLGTDTWTVPFGRTDALHRHLDPSAAPSVDD